jgi:hypothetical protein
MFFTIFTVVPAPGASQVVEFLSSLAHTLSRKGGDDIIEKAFCSEGYIGVAALWSKKFHEELDVSTLFFLFYFL